MIDVVAPDLPTLLNEIDGMKTEPKGFVLNTAGATVDTIEMSLWKRILDTLIDPNLIVAPLSIGVLGIIDRDPQPRADLARDGRRRSP